MIAAARAASSCCRRARIRSSPTRFPATVFLRIADVGRARDGGVLVGLFVAEPPAAPAKASASTTAW